MLSAIIKLAEQCGPTITKMVVSPEVYFQLKADAPVKAWHLPEQTFHGIKIEDNPNLTNNIIRLHFADGRITTTTSVFVIDDKKVKS